MGQTSRVDALKQAIEKAKSFGFDLDGAVMASDAFFPFVMIMVLAVPKSIAISCVKENNPILDSCFYLQLRYLPGEVK